jgi:2-polyprenyl-3-methyl-5-hydroxy-6-metoxy-1,4-benzoquinol methylase
MQTDLISEDYRAEQRRLHENPNYGVASIQFAPLVTEFLNQFSVQRLLDYGAGKGRLAQHIKPHHPVRITLYDPAVPDYAALPSPHEMVACIDVLEHIEPHLLDNVLDHLQSLTERLGFFTIHTGPAVKVLSDGRNAHLIQQPPAWWLPKILQRFELITFQRTGAGFWVLVARQGLKIE